MPFSVYDLESNTKPRNGMIRNTLNLITNVDRERALRQWTGVKFNFFRPSCAAALAFSIHLSPSSNQDIHKASISPSPAPPLDTRLPRLITTQVVNTAPVALSYQLVQLPRSSPGSACRIRGFLPSSPPPPLPAVTAAWPLPSRRGRPPGSGECKMVALGEVEGGIRGW